MDYANLAIVDLSICILGGGERKIGKSINSRHLFMWLEARYIGIKWGCRESVPAASHFAESVLNNDV